MKLAKGSPTVWPGYVAAVASLLLSLLLLLGILVFAMTQVHHIVSRYKESITRAVLEEDVRQRTSGLLGEVAAPAPIEKPQKAVVTFPSAQSQSKRAAMQESQHSHPNLGTLHLRLVFEPGAADLQQDQLTELAAAIRRQQVQSNTAWELKVQVPQSNPVFERSAYRLMLNVRSSLVAQGIPQKAVRMRMERTQAQPAGYEFGEIVIYALTQDKPAAEQGQP